MNPKKLINKGIRPVNKMEPTEQPFSKKKNEWMINTWKIVNIFIQEGNDIKATLISRISQVRMTTTIKKANDIKRWWDYGPNALL